MCCYSVNVVGCDNGGVGVTDNNNNDVFVYVVLNTVIFCVHDYFSMTVSLQW